MPELTSFWSTLLTRRETWNLTVSSPKLSRSTRPFRSVKKALTMTLSSTMSSPLTKKTLVLMELTIFRRQRPKAEFIKPHRTTCFISFHVCLILMIFVWGCSSSLQLYYCIEISSSLLRKIHSRMKWCFSPKNSFFFVSVFVLRYSLLIKVPYYFDSIKAS